MRENKTVGANARRIILVFLVFSGILIFLFYIPLFPTSSKEKVTNGKITFFDFNSDPVTGTIKISGTGIPGGQQENINSIIWSEVPNAMIDFNTFGTKGISINFRIDENSPNGRVIIGDHGPDKTGTIDLAAPGEPIKYMEIETRNVFFADANVTFRYTDEEIANINETGLSIYIFDTGAQEWKELTTRVDTDNNTISATVDVMSVFALGAHVPGIPVYVLGTQGKNWTTFEEILTEKLTDETYEEVNKIDESGNISDTIIEIRTDSGTFPARIGLRDSNDKPIAGHIRTYDKNKNLKTGKKIDIRSTTTEGEEIEFDALESKNVAVKLKVRSVNDGKIILDDFGKKNPVSVPLPGKTVKYVEIGANGISFSSASITIRYTDEELNEGSEDTLTIYHWNGASWDTVPTVIDTLNKTISATTTSLSQWGVAASVTIVANSTGNTGQSGRLTNENLYANNVTDTQWTTRTDISAANLNAMSTEDITYFNQTGTTSNDTIINVNFTLSDVESVNYVNISYNGTSTTSREINIIGLYNATEPSGGGWTKLNSQNQTLGTYATVTYNVTSQADKAKYLVLNGNTLTFRFAVWNNGTANAGLSSNLMQATVNYNQALAELSGYVTNASSGSSLSNATVQTNTSLSTTTNATGYYNLTGIANGTYLINTSLSGYVTNSTLKTISGADVTNFNISLIPLVLSGYVKDLDTGLPINGATVRTNNSNITTTNASGYYSFTGLPDGVYVINASISNYVTNSTTANVSGANLSNVNISLPIGYQLSGHVYDNIPSSPAISNVIVTTNTSQTTTTNASGYYNFTLSNGSYLITASKSGYIENSAAETIAGADIADIDILLTQLTGKILVATNRYVILDEQTTAGTVGPGGFAVPTQTYSWAYWTGINTQINATALYLDNDGKPVPDKNVTFTFYDPDGAINTSTYDTTNEYGLANASLQMNGFNFYGKWNVKASNDTLYSENKTFIYNWWGCYMGGCTSSMSAPTANAGRKNSPYLNGGDTVSTSNHFGSARNCTICHQSFDGLPGSTTTGTNHTMNTSDVHRNLTCNNANCHGLYTQHSQSTGGQLIQSCYNANCHKPSGTPGNRSDIANRSTLSSATPSSAKSLYSINSTSFNATFHTPGSTVPCIICHGPMHNITKPNETQRSINDNDTETTHCTTCHVSYFNHNSSNTTSGGVNCTLCHSDDVHTIQVFAKNGSYVTYRPDGNENPDRGDCTSCHKNSTLYNTLKNNTKAGPQGGGSLVPINPTDHSDAFDNGSRYGNYWTNAIPGDSCKYCHGDTRHKEVAFGRPAYFKGNNSVNSTFTGGNTTWCLSCHYPDYANYSDMVSTFTNDGKIVPPSIITGSQYFIKGRNHSVSEANDNACYICHNDSTIVTTTITQFMHDVVVGGGGPDCLSCHDIGKTESTVHVNNSAMNATGAVHKNLNQNATNDSWVTGENKKCWACHETDGTQPDNKSMGHRYSSPYTCYECHLNGEKPYDYVSNAVNVTNHIWVDSPSTQIVTTNATCVTCHNNSVNTSRANITDSRNISQYESVSHYGTRSELIDSIGNEVTSQGCIYCHMNDTNRLIWGNATDPRVTTRMHTETLDTECHICHIDSATLPLSFHNSSLIFGAGHKLLIALNRFVVLDDPNFGTFAGTGFKNPTYNWVTDLFNGVETTITIYGLAVDFYGAPVNNTSVAFTFRNPAGASYYSANKSTDSSGIANVSLDLNGINYYGKWQVSASITEFGSYANTSFIYNWWGCGGGAGCTAHSKQSLSSGAPINSTYSKGHDRVVNSGSHTGSNNCMYCHLSYNGLGSTAGMNTSDIHRNISCANPNCHQTISNHRTNAVIGSCYNSGCHGNASTWDRKDLSNKSTVNSTGMSLYSISSTNFNATFHTPNSTVPCIICHGPMHGITKPDTDLRFKRNDYTESSQCLTCHIGYKNHNANNITSGGVNCTLCHSDDIHTIQVLAKNGSYVTLNKNSNKSLENPDRSDCANCHQNTSYYTNLKNNTKAGPQQGKNPTVIPNPNHHSDAYDNGSRYGSFWTMGSADATCLYCHGDTKHKATSFGRPALFKGNNSINSTFAGGNTSWCLACHYPNYANYSAMVSSFSKSGLDVPPSIIKGSEYFVKGRNHSMSAYNDSACYACHNDTLETFTGTTEFLHDIAIGGGGPDCLSCHGIGQPGSYLHVNNSVMNASGALHRNNNQNATNDTWVSGENKKCWGCHQSDGSQPDNKSMGDRFSYPYTCYDCHLNDAKPYENIGDAVNVTNHIWVDSPLTRIVTHNATCVTCHNNSVNTSLAKITDLRNISQEEGVSHYGNRSGLIDSIGNEVSSQGCVYCHMLNANNPVWGRPIDPRVSSQKSHTESTNILCYNCHIESRTLPSSFHNSSIYFFGLGRIIIATNRFVILDDPASGKADTSSGFATPSRPWTSNYWSGINTIINATVLFVEADGMPQAGKIINFSLYYPNGTRATLITDTTSTLGLANFSFDMNAKNYYGKWKIGASNGGLSANSTFIYNWWGCHAVSDSKCSEGTKSPGSLNLANANSPYLSGRDRITNEEGIHHQASLYCTSCHTSYDGLPGGQSLANRKNYGADVHRNILCSNSSCHGDYTTHGTTTGGQLIQSCFNTGCHSRSDISRKSTLSSTTVTSAMSLYSSNNGSSINATYHTPDSTVPCFICHGPMHDITKSDPTQRFIKNNITESSQCTSCHQSSVKHNTDVECTVCHSQDVHFIQVFARNATYITLNISNYDPARGNCTDCHQNSSFLTALLLQPRAGLFTGITPQVLSPMEHSNDANAGNKWNQTPGYWTNSDQLSWCIYCHGDSKHEINALGTPRTWKGDNLVNSSISSGSWCAGCHWQGYTNGTTSYIDMLGTATLSPKPPEITGNPTYGANQSISGYINHNSFGKNDSSCFSCHNGSLVASATITDFMHNVSIGSGGGPDCIACHDLVTGLSGGAPSGINFTAANSSVHSGVNSINATSQGYEVIIGACWACHDSNGNVSSGHPDRYTTPKTCTECHLGSGTNNASSYNATIVTEHYYSGMDIQTGNATSNLGSCINCHENVSEMILYSNDNDTGSFSGDGIRLNGGNWSYYHYGKPRMDMRIGSLTNCLYCHQNASTAFSLAMVNSPYNSLIQNHSQDYVSPPCTSSTCHNSGWLHNSTLTKPVLTLPNSTYCTNSCHGTGGNALKNNKARHNNTLNCTQCHLNASSSIHPVRYLQNINNTWGTSNTSAVNCTNCHQNLTFWPGAPIIPGQLKHSSNSSNGSIWNSSSIPYWTGQDNACYYCHNNTKHNATALGSITSLLSPGNIKNGSLTTTRWCADCHYNASNPTYKGNLSQWFPTPPLITIDNTGKSRWQDHSNYFSSGYNDTICRACHAMNNTTVAVTSLNYSHSLDPGTSGGPDCISCHEYGESGIAPSNKRINTSSMRSGVHKNLNANATNSTSLDSLDKACWACHGDGTEPAGHPSNYSNPWTCVSCHNGTAAFTSSNATVQSDMTRKKTYEHIQYPYNESINSAVWNSTVTCVFCHNKSKVNFTDSVTPADALSANVSHYANTSNLLSPSINCSLCHKSAANSTEWKANLTRHPAKTQDLSYCANCHNSTNATDLHDMPLTQRISVHGGGSPHNGLGAVGGFDWEKDDFNETGQNSGNESCVACHGFVSYNFFSCELCHPGGAMNKPKLCENCHLPGTSSLFTGPHINGLYNLRSDINDTMPRVYAHTNYSNITNVTVPAQRGDNYYYFTTCYSYYNSSGNVMTCHGASYTSRSNFAGYYAQRGNDVMGSGEPAHRTQTIDRMPNTTNCLFCHNQSSTTVRQGWAGPMQVNASNMFGNRFSVNNISCYTCHTRNGTQPPDFHSNELTKGGGPGCLECHNNSDPQDFTAADGTSLHYIDGANFSRSVHVNLNSNNASGYGINASCWACHNSSGTAVANNTHPDKRDAPFTCPDCHLMNGTRAGAYNATIIYNHYKNGTGIKALSGRPNDVASCTGCHDNVSGMITPNNDSDTGSFATDGVGPKGGNNSFYHYGTNRSNFNKTPGSNDYCIYCHRNVTGEFNIVFQDAANMSISNHSLRYNSSNPSCSISECHNSTGSSLHGIQITKPNINISLHNSSYCLNCHGMNTTTNVTNYTGAVTAYKERHNNSVNCTECHTGPNKKNIHPVTYLQANGSFTAGNQTGINCDDCHQGSIVDNLLSFLPPKIPDPMHHGDNTSNGTAWNMTGYWISNSSITSCIYCHNDSRHNVTALGRPNSWKGDNVVNGSINGGVNISNWCSSCHFRGYSSGGKNYENMTYAFISSNLSVPPEITNGTYSPYNFTGYYNHTLVNYTDETCRLCHGKNISSDAGITAFIHNITSNTCTGCHYSFETMNSTNHPERFVDQVMFNASLHRSLTCENCHTQGHRNMGARKACEDCHVVQAAPVTDKDRHDITANPGTNMYNGESVVNITNCATCHNAALYNNSVNTYGYGKTKDCDYCHTYPDKEYR